MSVPDSLYLTADLSADHGLPSGTPCASSTRKKDEIADLSMQATLGSHDRTREGEAKDEEGEAISPDIHGCHIKGDVKRVSAFTRR